MGNSLCIIDDGFMKPATAAQLEQHKYFSSSTIELFALEKDLKEKWDNERALRSLCEKLLTDEDEAAQKKWNLTAFSNPEFFKETFEEENFRSDVLIFDWEYNQLPDFDQITFLRDMLKKTHMHIFIFSGQDAEEKIEKLLEDELSEYKEKRLSFLNKDNEDSYDEAARKLHSKISEKQDNNFSFKFGKELRKITNQSLDDVLLHLSEMDIEKIIKHFGENADEPVDTGMKEMIGVKIKDKVAESKNFQGFLKKAKLATYSKVGQFAETISEKIKNDIIKSQLPHDITGDSDGDGDGGDINLLEKLWSYRLYHHTDDGFVRPGDLIRKSGVYDGVLYLVLTGPCDLHRFWKNTGLRLNVVELLDVDVHKERIKQIAATTNNLNSDYRKKIASVSSLTNRSSLSMINGGPVFVPYVPFDEGASKKDFLLFPKSINNIQIDIPDALQDMPPKKRKDIPLKYDQFDYDLVCAVSDPFLSPLVGTVISDLFGWGVPDFSPDLHESLAKKAQGIFSA